MKYKKFTEFLFEKIRPSIDYSHDYYNDLDISSDSSSDEIKKAYKKLSMKYHPDRNKDKGSEQKFKEIGLAYNILSDNEWKSSYDLNYSPKGTYNNKNTKSQNSSSSFNLEDVHIEILNILKKTKSNSFLSFDYILKLISKKTKFKEYRDEDKLLHTLNNLIKNKFIYSASLGDKILYYILNKGLDELDK